MVLPGPLVDVDWLASHLGEVVVADVRWYLDGRSGREAYDGGHLPGSVFVDLDADLSDPPGPAGRHPLPSPEAFAAAMGRLGIGDGMPVVAYDDMGGIVASRLWWMLDVLGEHSAVLDGGIDGWSGPLSTDTVVPDPARFTARPWPRERFVDADEVDVLRARPNVLVLDARSAERYEGGPNPIDSRFGHIPGARNAPCGGNLEDGHMRPASVLRERYEHLGAHQVERVVAYCGSGVSACHDLLALELAGFEDTALYVGSWSEWGADPSRPVGVGDDCPS